jgi:myo-inositol-1(or 4)-monophosphatase
MRADDVPPCLVDLPSLPSIEWPMLLARLSHWGELLVDRQPALMGDGAALTAFEFELENDLIDLLRSQFGDVSVLAEETFHRTGQAVGTPGPLRLVLDPVDGSRSYADGSGIYAITLAAFLDDRPLFGIVHHPVDQITYAAARGRGAYRGTQRLKPSHTAPRRVAIRQRGMTAPVCWIADGRIAGVVKPVTERNGILSTWGLTAGQLVAEETGYLVTALDGSPWRWQPGEVAIGDAGFRSALNLH